MSFCQFLFFRFPQKEIRYFLNLALFYIWLFESSVDHHIASKFSICIPVLLCYNQELTLFVSFASLWIFRRLTRFGNKAQEERKLQDMFYLNIYLCTDLNSLMQHLFFSYFSWMEQMMLFGWNIPKAVKKYPMTLVPCMGLIKSSHHHSS